MSTLFLFSQYSYFDLTIGGNDFIVPKCTSVMVENVRFSNNIKNNNCMPIVILLSLTMFLYSTTFASSLYLFSFFQFFLDKSSVYAFAQTLGKEENATLSLSNLIKDGSPYQGSISAPIVLIDFSDLQCKLCQRFVKSTEPQINSTFIQTGKVVLVFKHLPNRGFDSNSAALAAQCTLDQGKFWQFHNLLYNIQGPIDSGWASKDNLKNLASQIPGLETQEFNSCFEEQKYKSFIDSDLALAHSLGFTQTPSFVIVKNDGSNPQKLEGPQSFPEFKAMFDKELGGK
jgi:protein-disulfide isomerase